MKPENILGAELATESDGSSQKDENISWEENNWKITFWLASLSVERWPEFLWALWSASILVEIKQSITLQADILIFFRAFNTSSLTTQTSLVFLVLNSALWTSLVTGGTIDVSERIVLRLEARSTLGLLVSAVLAWRFTR